MEKLSIANDNHNIRNIIWNVQSWKTGMFVGRGWRNYQGWTWTGDNQVTYTPFMLAFLYNFKKGGYTQIGDMAILLSLSILGTKTRLG